MTGGVAPKGRVAMVASFPPPVGGAALVNQTVLDGLRARGADVAVLDVSGPTLAHSRGIGYHLRRIAANLRAMVGAGRTGGRGHTLYLVPDAGLGAWYTWAIARAVAGRFGHVVVHHHSCRYIEEHSRPIAMLTDRFRDRMTHVFLTNGMRDAFQHCYGKVEAIVATNACFVAEEAALAPMPTLPGPLRLGHLSNLCEDKGFFVVADTFDAVRSRGIDATLTLAGPALEPLVEKRIGALMARHGDRVRHVGAVRGAAKRDVYRSIDIFLFPTQFRQEAAPLVLYEAMAAGVPSLTVDRGVIADVVSDIAGAVCGRDADYAKFVCDWIAREAGGDADRERRTVAIKERIRAAVLISSRQFDTLLDLLTVRPWAIRQ